MEWYQGKLNKNFSGLIGRLILCVCLLVSSFSSTALTASSSSFPQDHHPEQSHLSADHVHADSHHLVDHQASQDKSHCEGADCVALNPCAEVCSAHQTCCSAATGITTGFASGITHPRVSESYRPGPGLLRTSVRPQPDLRPPI